MGSRWTTAIVLFAIGTCAASGTGRGRINTNTNAVIDIPSVTLSAITTRVSAVDEELLAYRQLDKPLGFGALSSILLTPSQTDTYTDVAKRCALLCATYNLELGSISTSVPEAIAYQFVHATCVAEVGRKTFVPIDTSTFSAHRCSCLSTTAHTVEVGLTNDCFGTFTIDGSNCKAGKTAGVFGAVAATLLGRIPPGAVNPFGSCTPLFEPAYYDWLWRNAVDTDLELNGLGLSTHLYANTTAIDCVIDPEAIVPGACFCVRGIAGRNCEGFDPETPGEGTLSRFCPLENIAHSSDACAPTEARLSIRVSGTRFDVCPDDKDKVGVCVPQSACLDGRIGDRCENKPCDSAGEWFGARCNGPVLGRCGDANGTCECTQGTFLDPDTGCRQCLTDRNGPSCTTGDLDACFNVASVDPVEWKNGIQVCSGVGRCTHVKLRRSSGTVGWTNACVCPSGRTGRACEHVTQTGEADGEYFSKAGLSLAGPGVEVVAGVCDSTAVFFLPTDGPAVATCASVDATVAFAHNLTATQRDPLGFNGLVRPGDGLLYDGSFTALVRSTGNTSNGVWCARSPCTSPSRPKYPTVNGVGWVRFSPADPNTSLYLPLSLSQTGWANNGRFHPNQVCTSVPGASCHFDRTLASDEGTKEWLVSRAVGTNTCAVFASATTDALITKPGCSAWLQCWCEDVGVGTAERHVLPRDDFLFYPVSFVYHSINV